jgi:transposase
VIPVAIFDTIRHWRSRGLSRREIARRLHVDVKTVRRNLAKIKNGATAPTRTSPGSKLDPYRERIKQRVEQGCTAWSIFTELRTDREFIVSYELVKKYVAAMRYREPRVFERLEHLPGAEAQADFGELMRVRHQGRLVRTWAYVTVWPHSTWRYAEVVLEQQVPTFLNCAQNGFIAADAVPERFSIDNLRPGVFWKHFGERAYQREFASLCAHYDTMPNAVRVRRPTDKGAVENGVGVLKRGLRGREFETYDQLRAAVTALVCELNARPNSMTGKRPDDLIALETPRPVTRALPAGVLERASGAQRLPRAGSFELLLSTLSARRQDGRRAVGRSVGDGLQGLGRPGPS